MRARACSGDLRAVRSDSPPAAQRGKRGGVLLSGLLWPSEGTGAADRRTAAGRAPAARCLQQAKAVAGTERAGAVLQRLAKLDANMQQHRARIRAWATQKSIPPAVQTKLAAARTAVPSRTPPSVDVSVAQVS